MQPNRQTCTYFSRLRFRSIFSLFCRLRRIFFESETAQT